MKLRQVTIHNFKSIRNDCVLDIDNKVTALVGTSESGKTNVLKALEGFNTESQYQPDEFCTFCGAESTPDFPMFSCVFVFTDDERDRLNSMGLIREKMNEIAITKCFGGQYYIDGQPYPPIPSSDTPNEIQEFLQGKSVGVGELRDALDQVFGQRDDVRPQLESAQQAMAQLAEYLSQGDQFTPLRKSQGADPWPELLARWQNVQNSLTQLPEQTPEIQASATVLGEGIETAPETFGTLLESTPVEAEILNLAPKMVYLHDRDVEFLEDSIAIGDLEHSPEKHKTMMKLLAVVELTIEDLRITDATKRRRELLKASRRGSQALNRAWLQEPEISLGFDVTDDTLWVHIRGREDHYGRLSDRSEGFQWFLAFYLNYIASSPEVKNAVLLLDEPGIHLHASGQKDLLWGFEEIGKSAQIIYTTHSAYMINKNFPQRIRAVVKGGPELGTCVDNKAYRPTKGGPYEPIRSAIGLSLGNSLFLGIKNLIVEGISDHILLAAVSRRFASEGQAPLLDLQEACITPAGGAQNVPYLAYLASHEDMKTVVLLDSDPEGDKAAKRMEKEGVLSKQNVISIGDVALDKKDKILQTLEDLFDMSFYRSAILDAYKEVMGSRFDLPDFQRSEKTSDPRRTDADVEGSNDHSEQREAPHAGQRRTRSEMQGIVKQCDQYFEQKKLGDFDKVLVARKVAEKLDDGDVLDDKSQKRFLKLFTLITQKLA